MDIVLDSSSIINLINGEVFYSIFSLKNFYFKIGPLVKEECEKHNELDDAIAKELLELLPDVSLQQFKLLKGKYNLGDGETECIINCMNNFSFYLSCDDSKARRDAAKEVSEERVKGTLFLLREMRIQNLLDCDGTIDRLQLMKSKGGFLPNKGKAYFCK
ncbi:hypothetical protein [Xanthocytophaga agilis]|uniref:Uncharacterized protein n=1 Tax=Xanthocytophaga agilis TaxID=3048010 RepID=A0AAE3UF95_9BACT|nr:hypothetical protein [Xanthocytophaga agilis]MDJ1500328.1 hypothetical protein [Xanthocytophaga agilis]